MTDFSQFCMVSLDINGCVFVKVVEWIPSDSLIFIKTQSLVRSSSVVNNI